MKYNSPVIVVDSGMGNLASVANMIRKIGGEAKISSSPDEIRQAHKLILPGVGSFDAGINALKERSLDTAVKAAVKERWKKLEGVWVESNDEIEMKECFLKIASNNNDFMSYHGFIHSKSNIASTFLLSNPKWLGGPAYCKLKK